MLTPRWFTRKMFCMGNGIITVFELIMRMDGHSPVTLIQARAAELQRARSRPARCTKLLRSIDRGDMLPLVLRQHPPPSGTKTRRGQVLPAGLVLRYHLGQMKRHDITSHHTFLLVFGGLFIYRAWTILAFLHNFTGNTVGHFCGVLCMQAKRSCCR